MERLRVEEFGESKADVDESILFFSLKVLSRSSLQYVCIRGIYTGVCLECERSVFPKQGGLSRELTA